MVGYPPPPVRGGRTGPIVAGIFGVVVVLAVGVAVGVLAGGSADKVAAPPTYSMNAVANACDLVDPSPLTKWSATPSGPPRHRETRPTATDAGGLKCEIGYTTAGDPLDLAGITVEAEFTNGAAPPYYDHWKRTDTTADGRGLASGAVTGIGAQGYWHSEVGGDLVTDTTYVVCVLDGNVSVHVQLNFSRERGVAAVGRADLDPIAESQARKTLAGLKQN